METDEKDVREEDSVSSEGKLQVVVGAEKLALQKLQNEEGDTFCQIQETPPELFGDLSV